MGRTALRVSLARREPPGNKSVKRAVMLAGSLTKIKAHSVGTETATVGIRTEAINHCSYGSGVYLAGFYPTLERRLLLTALKTHQPSSQHC